MSDTLKHRDFVGEPMGNKSVTDLPGIGKDLGVRLASKGFQYAYGVLGQYLILEKDEEKFKHWLKEMCNANVKQQADCYGCLKEWCEQHMQ